MFSLKSNKLFRYSVMLTFLLFAQIQAQAPDILWSKSYGGLGDDWISQSIVPTPEGGFIMTGWYSRDSSDTDVWLLKTNADGDTLWTKTFGGSAIDYGSDIVITSEGDFVIAGITESFGAGEDDWWLIKTDADGNEIWNRTFGGAEDDEDISISKTTDNGYILTGQHAVSADGQVRLLKVDAEGDIIWENYSFPNAEDGSAGHCVKQTADGGYIIVGENDDLGIWLIKTDPNGNMEWNNSFGGTTTPWGDEGYVVEQTSDGGYIIGGETESFGPSADSSTYAWLIKTDSAGDSIWTRKFFTDLPDSIGASMGYGNSVIQTNDGGYVFTGFRGPNLANLELFLTKTDGNGFEQWTAIVEDAAGMCLTQTENGDFIVGGLTYSQAGDIDIFLARFEADPTGLNDDVSPVPVNYRLNQNYPNPFNPSTKISYSIPEPGLVTLEIFDVLGREIQTLVNEFQKPDNYELDFTAGELSSGVYFYTLRAGEFSKTKKMILLR